MSFFSLKTWFLKIHLNFQKQTNHFLEYRFQFYPGVIKWLKMPGFFSKIVWFQNINIFFKSGLITYQNMIRDVILMFHLVSEFSVLGSVGNKNDVRFIFLQKEHGSQNSPYNVCSSYLQEQYRGVLQMCNKVPKNSNFIQTVKRQQTIDIYYS